MGATLQAVTKTLLSFLQSCSCPFQNNLGTWQDSSLPCVCELLVPGLQVKPMRVHGEQATATPFWLTHNSMAVPRNVRACSPHIAADFPRDSLKIHCVSSLPCCLSSVSVDFCQLHLRNYTAASAFSCGKVTSTPGHLRGLSSPAASSANSQPNLVPLGLQL